MKDIIKVLEKEHRMIQATFNDLLRVCVTAGWSGAGQSLDELEKLIVNHVSKEDSQVYAPLKKIAKLTPQASEFLETSQQQLRDVKILSLVFFEKYKGEKNEGLCAGFPEDLRRLSKKIEERIVFEDKKLFPFLLEL